MDNNEKFVPTTSVVITAYNNVELFEKSFMSLFRMSSGDVEIIVVDNMSPDKGTRSFVNAIASVASSMSLEIKVLRPGKNLGCTDGYNYGFKNASGKYLVKIDDDTVIKTRDWDKKMVEVLEKNKNIAFLAPRSNVEQATENEKINEDFTQIKKGVLGFSLVMIPRTFIDKNGLFVSLDKYGQPATSLYGGEELYYCGIANREGMVYGYAENVNIEHLDNEDRDIRYVLWKMWYGYYGETEMSYDDFIKDEKEVDRAFNKWLTDDNEWRKEKAKEWFNNKK
jgi:glycosyltransferase involved in cell wall biosynthesis